MWPSRSSRPQADEPGVRHEPDVAGRGPRVALVHDWITGMRGGEKALEALCQMYPDAALFTLMHVAGSASPPIERLAPRASFIQHLPGARRFYRQYLPLFPTAIEQFDLDGYDLILSTSHCAAKSAVRTGRARHLCYCFTPMRYGWDQFDAYFGEDRLGPAGNALARRVLAGLARWDAGTAGRVDRYLAISQHVARRIDRYYNRTSAVVYPPVDTDFYCPATPPGGGESHGYFLIVSALVPYKRLEVAIEACTARGVTLKIVGQGPELARLSRRAGPRIQFLGVRTDIEIRELYRGALAALLPGEEDFGIAPVEAQACGRPVVALGRGGALETVRDGETGILVDDPSADAFGDALDRAARADWDRFAIRRHALRFSRDRFVTDMRHQIAQVLETGW